MRWVGGLVAGGWLAVAGGRWLVSGVCASPYTTPIYLLTLPQLDVSPKYPSLTPTRVVVTVVPRDEHGPAQHAPSTEMPSMRSEPSTEPELDAVLSMEPSLQNIGLILQTLMQAARRQQAEHGARMAALDARLKELEDESAEEQPLFSTETGVAAISAFGNLALRGKRAAKLKAEEALKEEIQRQVAAAVAVAKKESAAKQDAAVASALAAQQQAQEQDAQQAQLLARQAGEAEQEAAVAATLAAQQQAQLLAQQEQAAQQQAHVAEQALKGHGQLAQQLAEQQARQERMEARLAATLTPTLTLTLTLARARARTLTRTRTRTRSRNLAV